MASLTKSVASAVAARSDGRFSGGTTGLCIGHVAPESEVGGVIGLIEEGDQVRVDIPGRSLNVLVDSDLLAARREAWSPQPARYPSGALAKYARLVGSAKNGAVTG